MDDEMNLALNTAIGFAHEMLSEDGGLMPFAYAVPAAGFEDPGFAMAPDREPSDAVEELQRILRERAEGGEIVAAAVCNDAWFRQSPEDEPTEVLVIHLEHREGRTVELILPYGREEDGSIAFGDLQGRDAEPAIFAR